MATNDAKPVQLATSQLVPDTKIFSIEFPGHVQNLDKVKEALGGEQAITNASDQFTQDMAYLGGAPLDLRYRVRDPFSIPIQGETISTANLLVKATRRFRVKRQPGAQRSLPPYRAPKEDDVPYDENEEPELQFEMVGHIPKTARFGGLADYQHIVDPRDEFSNIKSDLVNVEYENLIALKVDHTDPREDDEKLQLLPPPFIAKTTVSNYYKYKPRDTDSTPRRRGRKSGSVRRKEGGLTDSITIDSDFTEDDEV